MKTKFQIYNKLLCCGIDIEDKKRFVKYNNNFPLKNEIFTGREIINYTKSGNSNMFPISFCCKEAFFKALGQSWTNSDILWKDIELFFFNNLENYKIKISGKSQTKLKQLKCKII